MSVLRAADIEDSSRGPIPGDAAALETLRAGLRIMALHRLRDADRAAEAVQETLVRVMAAMSGPARREIRDLGAYAQGVARHVIADICRAAVRHVPLEVAGDVPDAAAADPLEAAVTEERRRRILAGIASLSRRDAALLRLSFYDGLDATALAERFGEPAARIRKRKSRALARLRQALLEDGR